MTLLDEALAWQALGYAPVPIRTDGSKAPAVHWSDFADAAPTIDELNVLFTTIDTDGIGLLCGKPSGNLEMLELEARAITEGTLTQLVGLLTDHGYGHVWETITNGYVELTPTGGMHWYYRVDGDARGNTKLARRPATASELATKPGDRTKVLIETRGNGGFTVVAPSAGRTHPNKQPWRIVRGNKTRIPTLTIDERDALYALASLLDTLPTPLIPTTTQRSLDTSVDTGTRPGDYYNAQADWNTILTPHGWQRVRHYGGNCYGWLRAGKTGPGISATTGRNNADNLYVFSSSTPFDTETPYSKFAAYAILNHNGDYTTAAKQLYADGYHAPEEPRPDHVFDGLIPPPPTQPDLAPAAASFYENDEPVEKIVAAFEHGTKGVTGQPVTYSLTDDGNALRLIDTHGACIRYCPQRGYWLRWDGHRWASDEAESIRELVRVIARDFTTNDHDHKTHRKWSLSTRGVTAAVRLAQSDERTVVHAAHLDNRPYELNTPAGVVDLPTGRLRGPDPTALHTRSTHVAPTFDQTPQRWLAFLADTFAGDPALTTYMQRLLGQSLIGTVREQVLPFAYGSGANGKTTLLGAVQRILGIGDGGYALSAPAEILLATSQDRHPTEIARLAGARLVVTSELEDGQRFAESKVKKLTGRDIIEGRFMRRDFFSFAPTHTLWLLANHQPTVRAGGPAFWRRIRLLPFLHTVPPEARDPDLEDHLVDREGPSILGWLIRGATDYLTAGLDEPASVLAATQGYEREQDTVARFIAECCEVGDPNAQHLIVNVTPFRQAYETWCRIEGETPVSPKALTVTLRARYGVVSDRVRLGTKITRRYLGIRLQNDVTDPSHQSVTETPDSEDWWKK